MISAVIAEGKKPLRPRIDRGSCSVSIRTKGVRRPRPQKKTRHLKEEKGCITLRLGDLNTRSI
jgi:hypothetical protein